MRYRARLCLLVLVATAVVAIRLGDSRALSPHEIYVAGTATEMLAAGEFLVPQFNGKARIEKPPLSYWLAIAAHELTGDTTRPRVTEREARLPSLLSAAALLVVTYALGAAAFEPRVGILASAFLATSYGFFTYARSARPEMLYALLCTVVLLGFVRAMRNADEGTSTMRAAVLAWTALGAALLAKGPQIPAFFVLAALMTFARSEPRRSLRATLHPWLGIAAVAAVAPYFLYVAAHTENALGSWTAEVVQDQPVPLLLRPFQLYYPFSLVVGLVPWLGVAGYTVARCWRRREPRATILVASVLVTLAFLSFAGKLRPHYVLPILPACAVLMAWAFVELRDRALRAGPAVGDGEEADTQRVRARLVLHRLLGIQALFALLAIAAFIAVPLADECTLLVSWPRLLTFAIVAAALVLLAYIEERGRAARAWTTLVAAMLVVWCGVAASGLDGSWRWRAERRFARDVRMRVPKDRTVLYDSGTLEPLVYYGGLRVVVRRFEHWSEGRERIVSNAKPPLFVCEDRCFVDGVPARGRVLEAAPRCGSRTGMVLFDPAHARRRAVRRHTCADDPS